MRNEWNKVKERNNEERSVAPLNENDLKTWRGYLAGPSKETHSFELRFLRAFPLEPPEVEWLTPIVHPNIEPPKPDGLGRVCVDVLDITNWTPFTDVNTIVNSIYTVLQNPNPGNPMAHPACLRASVESIEAILSKNNTIPDDKRKQVAALLAGARASLARLPGGTKIDEFAHNLVKQAALALGVGVIGKGAR